MYCRTTHNTRENINVAEMIPDFLNYGQMTVLTSQLITFTIFIKLIQKIFI